MYPLLPFYAEHFGASPTLVGLLISTYAVCQLVSGPLLGRMSDRSGRRPLLLASQVGTFAGFIILANAWSLWVVFLSRVIDGMTAGNISLAQAYISDVTAPEKRAKAFGVIGVAFGVGFLIGPARLKIPLLRTWQSPRAWARSRPDRHRVPTALPSTTSFYALKKSWEIRRASLAWARLTEPASKSAESNYSVGLMRLVVKRHGLAVRGET